VSVYVDNVLIWYLKGRSMCCSPGRFQCDTLCLLLVNQ